MGAPPKNETLVDPTDVRITLPRPAGARVWLRVARAATRARVTVNGAHVGTHRGAWTPFAFDVTPHVRSGDNDIEVVCEDELHTTNGFLPDIGLRWTGASGVTLADGPWPVDAPARQRSAVDGTRLLLDDRPFRVKGLLHWGYYPELGTPWPDEAAIRAEIALLQSCGFNLVKFCLWVPPRRYYELCDEAGLLVWQEYPCWNAPLDDPAIVEEYRAMFRQDRGFGCVILRTLTCENDRVLPEVGAALIAAAREEIPGCVVLDNSGWLCNEHAGDFHDEHPYLHNAQWKYYAQRLRGKLRKPLLLGEAICADAPADDPVALRTAMAVRQFQVETLAAQLPEAGYVLNVLRDIKTAPLGICTAVGVPKYPAIAWAWQRALQPPTRTVPPVLPEDRPRIIGPRDGQWKHTDWTWWSPVIKVLDDTLPRELIEREAVFELLSGRVLTHTDGTRVLVEAHDLHSGKLIRRPLVIEFASDGQPRVVSALRHDTPAGRVLWDILSHRENRDAPEIGPLVGAAIMLDRWQMTTDGAAWQEVLCDTPLVNAGANVFEGWATFRTTCGLPGGPLTLCCHAVGDYFEFDIFHAHTRDRLLSGSAGPRDGTWDGVRDVPREFAVDLPAGRYDVEFRVRDWRGGGGMVGPVFFADDLSERIF